MNDILEISEVINRGGSYDWIPGATLADVFHNLMQKALLPGDLSADTLCRELNRREEMMTTAVGNGVALPHPNFLLLNNPDQECIIVCYPKKPLEVKAPDRKPVTVLFILLMSSSERHLQALGLLARYINDAAFMELIKKHAGKDELCAFLKLREKEIKKS